MGNYFKVEKEKEEAMKWFNSLDEGEQTMILKNLNLINPNRKEIHKLWIKIKK